MSVNQDLKPITTKRHGNLHIGGCDLSELAAKYGTPLYVVDEDTFRKVCQDYKNAFKKYPRTKMMYASKALCTSAISKIIAQEGFGFDAVSIGELYTIHKAGISLEKVLFNGNNKTEEELDFAIANGVGRISVDNFEEVDLISKVGGRYNKIINVLLRVTPGIECHTHEYIQTGQLDCKFGFDLSQVDKVIDIFFDHFLTNLR